MAQLITLRWRKRQGIAPGSSDQQDDLFNVSRVVKTEPSTDADDAAIKTRVLYNEGPPHSIEYHLTDTVAEILALANG